MNTHTALVFKSETSFFSMTFEGNRRETSSRINPSADNQSQTSWLHSLRAIILWPIGCSHRTPWTRLFKNAFFGHVCYSTTASFWRSREREKGGGTQVFDMIRLRLRVNLVSLHNSKTGATVAFPDFGCLQLQVWRKHEEHVFLAYYLSLLTHRVSPTTSNFKNVVQTFSRLLSHDSINSFIFIIKHDIVKMPLTNDNSELTLHKFLVTRIIAH